MPIVPAFGAFYLLVKHYGQKDVTWWLDQYAFHRDVATTGWSSSGLAMLFRPADADVPLAPDLASVKVFNEIGWAAVADHWPRPRMYVAAKTGDLSATGKIWTFDKLDRTLSTVSIADGLLYIADLPGRLYCLDAETGACYWVHDTKQQVWGSTLVADGKVYMPTSKGLWVLSAGKELKILHRITLGGRVYASPIVANGTLYIATTTGWLWAVGRK